jgi:hypothetical protein
MIELGLLATTSRRSGCGGLRGNLHGRRMRGRRRLGDKGRLFVIWYFNFVARGEEGIETEDKVFVTLK